MDWYLVDSQKDMKATPKNLVEEWVLWKGMLMQAMQVILIQEGLRVVMSSAYMVDQFLRDQLFNLLLLCLLQKQST